MPEWPFMWPIEPALNYICFGHCGGECIWKSQWSICGADIQGKTRWPLSMWFWTCSCITKNSSFQNCIADQDKNHRQVWYYLRMQALLVVYFTIMVSLMLCLLDVLYFIPYLSEGSLLKDWEATRPHSEMSLVADLQWNATAIFLWTSVKNWCSCCD